MFAFFAITAVGMMWPQYPATTWGTMLDHVDIDATYLATVIWWEHTAILSNPGAIMDAPFFSPAKSAVAASDHILSLSLLTLPLAWMPGNPLVLYRVCNVLMIALTGWGMWLLVTRLTGSRLAGLLAGVIWAFCPHALLSLNRAHVMPSPFWAPLVLFLIRDHVRPSVRTFAAALAMLLLSVYTGWYMTLFTMFLMACWCLAVAIANRGRPGWAWTGRMALAGLVVAVALLPVYFVYSRLNTTVYFFSDTALRSRFLPWQMAIPSWPYPLGRLLTRCGVELSEFHLAYTGIVVWLLLVSGGALFMAGRRGSALWSWTRRPVPLFAIFMVLVGAAFAAGPRSHVLGHDIYLPFTWIGRIAEPLKFSRWPSRYGTLAVFGLAILAGFSALYIGHLVRARWGLRAWRIGALSLCALATVDLLPRIGRGHDPVPMTPVLHRLADRENIDLVAETPLYGVEDATAAMLHMSVHGKPIPHGYSDIGYGTPNLEDFLNTWPSPVSRAAVEYLGIDALLIVPERMREPVGLETAPEGWTFIDRDERFVLAVPDPEVPAEVCLLLDQVRPGASSPPEPIHFDAEQLLATAWTSRLQFDGEEFRTSVDPILALTFDAPIDTTVYRRIRLRVRLDRADGSPERTQIFWRGPNFPQENEVRTAHAPVDADGEWTEVVFDLSDDPRWVWSGPVSTLRWDVTMNSNVTGRIGSITLE